MNDESLGLTRYLYEDNIGRVQLVQHWGSDATVVRSARVSFGNDSDGEELSERDVKLVEYLIKNKHTSTLEHCGATFKFVVPLFIRSQHHRHRTWSYNEISRRYTDCGLQFYEPEQFRTQHKNNRQASSADKLIDPDLVREYSVTRTASERVRELHAKSLELYNELIDSGVCREQARGVLPQNLYTEYYGTCNLSNLLKFIDLRMHEGAQWEIQVVAEACLEFAKNLFPVTVESYLKTK
jgi:thymidylate synthase (FAD)